MARSPFDPAEAGLRKTEYRQADVLDADAVAEVVAGADVVVHLAFVILGDLAQTTSVNLEGSRNVFAAAIAAGAKRLVYASSVAAYGYHGDNPELLTEDVPTRGTDRHYYSAQKAELEAALLELLAPASTAGYVFRPCIVAGPDALTMLESIPYVTLSERMPAAVLRALEFMPALKPVIPDPGVSFQLVHHDDVATAMRAAVLGRGEPGVYNLAASGTITMSDLAAALGWYSVPGARPRRRRRRRTGGAAALRARRGAVDRDRPPPGADGHDASPEDPALASASRRRRDAGRDGRGRTVGPPDPLSGRLSRRRTAPGAAQPPP